jgi:hypothetical protein
MLALGIAALIILPHLLTLGRFITSDEPLWIVRSTAFLQGLLTGDLRATLQTGHPGVTTMWTGSLGLVLDYLLHHRDVGSLLTYVQNLPADPMQVDSSVITWVRLPTALLALFCVWAVYRLARPMGRFVAIGGSLLLGLHPFFLAHSRVLHHDALVSIFISLSLLAWLARLQPPLLSEGSDSPAEAGYVPRTRAGHFGRRGGRRSWGLTIVSGVAAGLAFLSKSSAYILIPFVALMLLAELIRQRRSHPSSDGSFADTSLLAAIRLGLVWLGVAGVTFVLFWPALWVDPASVFSTVFGWASQSASLEDASETVAVGWSGGVPDLGSLFYPVNWLLRTTPLTLAGLIALPLWWRRARQDPATAGVRWWAGWLAIWSLLFSLALSLGDKRDARYLLPIYFALCLLAALGLLEISNRLSLIPRGHNVSPRLPASPPWLAPAGRGAGNLQFRFVFAVLLLGLGLLYHPYYLAYYNPLLGGPWIAPRLTKVGWGEGMEQAAAYLNRQPHAERLVVATSYAQNFLPYFAGKTVKHHESEAADYVLNYIRQIQNGYPYPEYWQYYRAREPVFRLKLAGIDYLWLYRGPSLAPVRDAHFGNGLDLMGLTLGDGLVEPGTTIEVTLVWRATDASSSNAIARVQLIDEEGAVWGDSLPAPVFDPAGPSLVEGHYRLSVLPDAPRFDGRLRVSVRDAGGQSLDQVVFDQIPVRSTSLPASAIALPGVNLGDQISLLGYQVSAASLAPGQAVDVTLYWRAETPINFDYTVFVQLLGADGNIYGQDDAQPVNGLLPTSQWTGGEVVADPHRFSVAPDAPPGDYRLMVGMYRWDTGQRLPVVDDTTGQNAVILSPVRIQTY